MFDAKTLAFLSDLKAHNDRTWFAANRVRYEAHVAAPIRDFVAAMETGLAVLAGQPVEGRVFRIHRDVRFSKDKTPYNTHIHIAFHEAGAPLAWLVGVEPGKLVIGYGSMGFEPAMLEQWRKTVSGAAGAELAAILARLLQRGLRIEEPSLRRVPAPYDQTHPQGDLLRRKELAVWDDTLPIETAFGEGGPARLVERMRVFEPLRAWFAAFA